ncbi:UNVERIFIED_CONTAM: hypothetical protein DQE83_27380, partial [Escherichia coli]
MRVFGTGDVQHFLAGTGWSPWWVWTLGGYGVAALIVDLYARVLPRAYLSGPCGAPGARAGAPGGGPAGRRPRRARGGGPPGPGPAPAPARGGGAPAA